MATLSNYKGCLAAITITCITVSGQPAEAPWPEPTYYPTSKPLWYYNDTNPWTPTFAPSEAPLHFATFSPTEAPSPSPTMWYPNDYPTLSPGISTDSNNGSSSNKPSKTAVNPLSSTTTSTSTDGIESESGNVSERESAEIDQSIWIVILFILCIVIVALIVTVWRMSRSKKKRKSQGATEQMADYVDSTANTESEGDEKYSKIIVILKECEVNEWEQYLDNFKREMVTDKALEFMECDPTDDAQQIWKELLPQFGVRVMFKTLWNQKRSGNDANNHTAATTTGLVVLEAGNDSKERHETKASIDSELYGNDGEEEEEGADTNLRRTTPAGIAEYADV